ncbi:enoyl-CoA hydratase/isomerase family protein [Citricoccus alkalitolerans]|uniref:3-hydroxyisobutyryl-CoA hydrolase n=1 Tax=Citricoccus alkalitolerans TaxID=246603 RepID=A0ABV8XY50_9MICC
MSTDTPATDTEPEVLIRRAGHLGHLILNRPKALNSLTHGMVKTIKATLETWKDDASVNTVLISGAGEKGLCAGGDIVSVYRSITEGHPEDGDVFFADEYAMNSLIAEYPKPYVAFMDGIVLGGGVGVSAHGSHRIVTERTRLGMPETGIGFFPDVGGSWMLARTPSHLGMHMALTSGHVTGADALAAGFADHFVPAARLEELALALVSTGADEAIAAVATAADDVPPAPLAQHERWIESCYSATTAEEIVAALQADGAPEAAAAAEAILGKCPTSVKITLDHVRGAAQARSVQEVLEADYRLTYHLLRAHNFPEGIRALLVDKDRNPQWEPATLDQVTADEITALTAPVEGRGLTL